MSMNKRCVSNPSCLPSFWSVRQRPRMGTCILTNQTLRALSQKSSNMQSCEWYRISLLGLTKIIEFPCLKKDLPTTQPCMKYLPIVLFIFMLACQPTQTEIKPTVEPISESVYASGIVKSDNQYQVFSSVNGIVAEIYAAEGDTVQKGSALVRIDNRAANLQADNAQLAAAYADTKANTEKLEEARLTVALARAKLKNDSLLLARQHNLMAQNIGTKVELEQRELTYQNSRVAYQSARIHYRDLQRQITLNANQTENTAILSHTLANDYIIRSQRSGTVYSLTKEVGEFVSTQTPLALVGDSKDYIIELQVDEYDIVNVKPQQRVILRMDSYKNEVFEARVTKINPLLNERSKTFTVEAHFTQAPPTLYPFLTVEANIVIQTKAQALTIPRNCLVQDSLVLTKNRGKQKVVIGLMDYQKVEILSGLSKEDVLLLPEN